MSPDTIQDIGWTLIHFLWQGVVLAALLSAILPLCRTARARHNLALCTLMMMAAAPAVTFLFLRQQDVGAPGTATGHAVSASLQTAITGLEPIAIPMPWMEGMVFLWLAGIAVLSIRALGGWYLTVSLSRHGVSGLPAEVIRRCQTLRQRLAINWPIRFLQSYKVCVPTVVGWLRPVILLPVSAIAGLPPQQLDALILHELAHIRRLDAFTNILLVAIETLLFYHPAVWLVARRVRIEREHCCDDMAVAICGDAAAYVEALTSLAHNSVPAMALAASGEGLKERAARLLGAPSQSRRFSLSALTGLVLLGAVIATVAIAQNGTPPGHQDFAIRMVDESVGKNVRQGPVDDDRARMFMAGKDATGIIWLKREGEIAGNVLADASSGVSPDGKALIKFRLTPEAARRFAALTAQNVGHRLAIIVKGRVLTAPMVVDPILGGSGEISGDFNAEQARVLVAQMMGTDIPR
jgi:beta-lactamase regulating signal transducer with metallopeptidase domain